MKMHYIFYIVGIIFIFATVVYFTKEFIDDLPRGLKLLLLILSIIISFVLAEIFRGGSK